MTGVFTPGRELTMYRTQGLDLQNSVKALAGCGHPRRGTNITRNGFFPARNDGHATQQEQKKQRRKACSYQRFIKIYMQETMQTKQPQMNADGHESESVSIAVHPWRTPLSRLSFE